MNTYVLIGGKDPENSAVFQLEAKILKELQLKKPNILWIPFASDKKESRWQQFQAIKRNYPCQLDCLFSLEKEEIEEKVAWADVLYFCGGCAEKLVELVSNSALKAVLQIIQNKVCIGISAGAMLFCRAGMGDHHMFVDAGHCYNYQMVSGLGLLDLTFCPHYNHDGLWCYNDAVLEYPYDGYASEDETAIIIQDDVKIVKTRKDRSVYFFSKVKKYQMIPLYEEEGK